MNEKIFLFKNIIDTPIEYIYISGNNIMRKIRDFISIRNQNLGLNNIQIYEKLELNKNVDFTSKSGLPFSEEEDKFIIKMYNDCNDNPNVYGRRYRIPMKDWNKFKALEGRTFCSINTRLMYLKDHDFKIDYKTFKTLEKRDDTDIGKKKRWSKKDLTDLEKQKHLPLRDIIIPGRSIISIRRKLENIYTIGDVNKMCIKKSKDILLNQEERVKFLK